MALAKLFKHGGSQAVRLPKAFRFAGSEVVIERRGREVVLKPKAGTLADLARELHEKFPDTEAFPEIERSRRHERPELEW